MRPPSTDIFFFSAIALLSGCLIGGSIVAAKHRPTHDDLTQQKYRHHFDQEFDFKIITDKGHRFAIARTYDGIAMVQIIEQDAPAFSASTIVERAGIIDGDWLIQIAPPNFDYVLHSNRWFEDYGIASRLLPMPGSSNLILFKRR